MTTDRNHSIRFDYDIHMEITNNTNKRFTLFDEQELAAVIAANMAQDLRQGDSFVHFDNCAFSEGASHVQNLWKDILHEKSSLETALFNFGALLHTSRTFIHIQTGLNYIRKIHLSPFGIWI